MPHSTATSDKQDATDNFENSNTPPLVTFFVGALSLLLFTMGVGSSLSTELGVFSYYGGLVGLPLYLICSRYARQRNEIRRAAARQRIETRLSHHAVRSGDGSSNGNITVP